MSEHATFTTDLEVNHLHQLIEHAQNTKNNGDSTIRLYDRHLIKDIEWPNTQEGQYAKNFLAPYVNEGINHFIDNIDVEMRIMKIDDHIIPIVIANNNFKNSYICSPHGHYITLALDKLSLFKNVILRNSVETILKVLGKILRKGKINQLVYVNHWQLSTDIHPPELTRSQIERINVFLQKQFPTHAIAFRSLNLKSTEKHKQSLQECGFKFLASRQVYLTDTSQKDLFKTRIIKSDLKQWRESGYEVVEGSDLTYQEKKRLLELYHSHSITSHSSMNPQFNFNFINLMIKKKLLHIKALKKNGVIDGVAGYQIKDGIFFCPFFGYDKTQPDHMRLYRLLSTMLLLESAKEGYLFHQSAGASFYKKIRRAQGETEYLGIYTKHLGIRQRTTWWLIKAIMNGVAVRFMKNY